MQTGCPEALSIVKSTLKSRFLLEKYFFTPGIKGKLNHSKNKALVTHALLFALQNTGNSFLFLFLRQRGFRDLKIIIDFALKSSKALAHNKREM